MTQTITRIYGTEQQALDAVALLKEFDYAAELISLVTYASVVEPGSNDEDAATESLVEAIAANWVPKWEARIYAEGVRRGGSLVSVRAPFGTAAQAIEILDSFEPIDAGVPVLSESLPEWDEAAPISSAFRMAVRYDDPTPFSTFWNLPVLIDRVWSLSRVLGLNELVDSSSGLSSFFHIPTLTEKAAWLSSKFGLPMLSESATPLSDLLHLPVLKTSNISFVDRIGLKQNPAPLSSLLGLPALANHAASLSATLGIPSLADQKASLSKLLGAPELTDSDMSTMLHIPLLLKRRQAEI
jgi:hypothetical protein